MEPLSWKQATPDQRSHMGEIDIVYPLGFQEDADEYLTSSGPSVWSRPQLTPAERSIVTISLIIGQAVNEPMQNHISLGLRNGLSKEKIYEILRHSAMYVGFPLALNAMRQAATVFDSDRPWGGRATDAESKWDPDLPSGA
jgi:4-carboxymuconolactone decarboxylase